MTSEWRPFLLVRPCGMPFLEGIEADLRAARLLSDSRLSVRSWREVSRRLYFDQYGHPDSDWRLQDGAEAWLDTTVALYGNTALCLYFGTEQAEDARHHLARRLSDFKFAFRRRRRAERTGIRLTYTAVHGSWPIYFDGVHVPEPDPIRIRWELEVVEALVRSATLTPQGPDNA